MRETQGSDLPKFTPEESQLLRDTTIDFFSVNFYCGYYVWAPPADAPKNMVRWSRHSAETCGYKPLQHTLRGSYTLSVLSLSCLASITYAAAGQTWSQPDSNSAILHMLAALVVQAL